MGKQKMVLKLAVKGAKKRSKTMKMVMSLNGVLSAGLEGEEKDKLVVVGDGVDVVKLTMALRKKMGLAEMVSVAAVEEYHQVAPFTYVYDYPDDIFEYSDNECVPTCSLMLIDCYFDHE